MKKLDLKIVDILTNDSRWLISKELIKLRSIYIEVIAIDDLLLDIVDAML